ncbi:MAG: hypothetical protein HY598_04275 [Candidatus Omnitrophica bacterium]|nr:hypothetical protein [Candidatus Omnitrophota bacterium]
MTQRLISTLVVITGVLAASVGLLIAAGRLRAAGRAYRKIGTLYETMPEGWSSWFLGGFSGLTPGTQWLRALAALAVWVTVGAWFIGLGLRLFWRV